MSGKYSYQTRNRGRRHGRFLCRNAVSDGFPGNLTETITLLPAGQLPSVLIKDGEQDPETGGDPGIGRSAR